MSPAELGRRAVEAEGWRWMPGMADGYGGRVTEADDRGVNEYMDRKGYAYSTQYMDVAEIRNCWGESSVPDFDDPATRGCILSLVREKHRNQHIYCMFSQTIGAWVVPIPGRDPIESYVSEAEALIAALCADAGGGR